MADDMHTNDDAPVSLTYSGQAGYPASRPRRRALWILFVCIIVAALGIGLLIKRSSDRARDLSLRVSCASNLRGIGQAMYRYAENEPDGAFPDDLNKLMATGLVRPNQMRCPWAPPGNKCYYYVPGQTTNSDPSGVVIFEDPQIHGGEGGNVLYQNGHVMFVKMPQYQTIVDKYRDNAQ